MALCNATDISTMRVTLCLPKLACKTYRIQTTGYGWIYEKVALANPGVEGAHVDVVAPLMKD
jgi:hypothetical protein